MVSIMYFEEVSVLLLLTKIHVGKISCWQKALLVKCMLAKSMLVQSLLENFVVALEHRPFLAALSSSRSLVVCPSVRPSVGRSVRPLTFVKK